MQRIKNVFAKRKIPLAPESGKLIAAAHLKKLAPETDDGYGYEKPPPVSYEFEEWSYEEGKPSSVVIRVSIEADKESVLKEYNDLVIESFGEGCRDKKRKKEKKKKKKKKKSDRKLFGGGRGVGSTFRRVFLRGA